MLKGGILQEKELSAHLRGGACADLIVDYDLLN